MTRWTRQFSWGRRRQSFRAANSILTVHTHTHTQIQISYSSSAASDPSDPSNRGPKIMQQLRKKLSVHRRLEREQSWEFIGDRPASWPAPSTTLSTVPQSWSGTTTQSTTRLTAVDPPLCSSPPHTPTPTYMDPRRRVGPRAQAPPTPESRNAAYEGIFGRPSVTHHLTPPNQYGPRGNGGFGYSHSLRQPASTSSLAPSQVAAHYRQQYQQHHTQQSHQGYNYNNYNNHNNGYANYTHNQNYNPPQPLAPPSVHSRARSFAGTPQSGDIVPQPVLLPDPALERYTRQGMTPAQAYQAQVYSNDRQNHPRAEPPRGPPPHLEVLEVDTDGGHLDLDFNRGASTANGSHAPRDLDESDSELPWAANAGQRTRESFPTGPVALAEPPARFRALQLPSIRREELPRF